MKILVSFLAFALGLLSVLGQVVNPPTTGSRGTGVPDAAKCYAVFDIPLGAHGDGSWIDFEVKVSQDNFTQSMPNHDGLGLMVDTLGSSSPAWSQPYMNRYLWIACPRTTAGAGDSRKVETYDQNGNVSAASLSAFFSSIYGPDYWFFGYHPQRVRMVIKPITLSGSQTNWFNAANPNITFMLHYLSAAAEEYNPDASRRWHLIHPVEWRATPLNY